MPKNFDDVIVPERRKSIRNIPIPEGRRRADGVPIKRVTRARLMDDEAPPPPPPPTHKPFQSYNHSKRNYLIAGSLAVIILVFGILSLFNSATLAYLPKAAKLTFSGDVFSASKTGDGKLLYSVVKLSGEKGIAVPASGEHDVSKKATGTIIVYNTGTAAQALVATTRFQTSDGKIYRINQSITVPAKGSVEAVVAADVAGASYNISLTDFTVPGLKGSPKYSLVYARSKTPMTGGFIGKEPMVTPDNLAKAEVDLKKSLSQDLMVKAQAEVPADFYLSPSLSYITYEELPETATSDQGSATVNLRGNLFGIMFKKSDLASSLADKKLNLTGGTPVDLNSFDSLQMAFAGTAPTDLLPANDINFKVTGTATVVWKTDEAALRSDLAGRNKGDLSSVLKNYPTIASANVTLRPFWKTAFPSSADKISVKKEKVE